MELIGITGMVSTTLITIITVEMGCIKQQKKVPYLSFMFGLFAAHAAFTFLAWT